MTALLKVDCLYGVTKSTKTSRLGEGAEYWAEKTGKPARGVFSDTGSFGSIQNLVDTGVVIPFVLTPQRQYLLEDMRKLAMGWWPKDHNDPKSVLQPPEISKVSCLLFDSGTSMCDLLGDMHTEAVKLVKNAAGADTMVATTVKVPEMPKDSYVTSGEYIYRFQGRSDYMGIQSEIAKIIKMSAHLPVPSIWTFGETTGEDEYTSLPIGGPDFYGNKLTGRCGRWFGNLLHLSFIKSTVQEKVDGVTIELDQLKPYLFTVPHTKQGDPKKIPYQAGTRVDKRLWQKIKPVLAPDLKAFYKQLDVLQEEAKHMAGSVTLTQSNGENK